MSEQLSNQEEPKENCQLNVMWYLGWDSGQKRTVGRTKKI